MLKPAPNGLLRSAIRRLGVKEGGVSALAIGASMLAPYALAQDSAGTATTPSAEQSVEEIVVTGMREALKTAQDIKREADTVVDSITASDIGAFPDKSVAEALQRVTGVFVTRFAAASDTTHFSAEPSGVLIRGLPQVRSEFNGRDSFNANSSRGLGFGDVSPELMAGVDTYKNLTADMIEGGIAGTINLRTALPFDSDGFVAAFSAEADYGDIVEELNPEGSVLMSNRWSTGIGEIGVMANAAYSKVTTASQGVQLGRYYRLEGVDAYGGGTKWIPGGIDVRETIYDRTRIGASFASQWRSPDESLLATLQYNRSEYQNDFDEYSLTAGIGNSQTAQDLVLTSPLAIPPEGAPAYQFDNRGVFTRGVLTDSVDGWAGPNNSPRLEHPNGYMIHEGFPHWYCYSWSVPDGTTCPSTRGIGLSADSRVAETKNVTQDVSLNLKWNVNDRLALNFDLQHIDSTVDNFDNSANSKTAADVSLDLTGRRPRFEFNRPTGFGFTPGGFADPANYYHEWVMEHAEQSEGQEWAGRIDAEIDISNGWV
ncbi:MAG: TonB-dependent receptor plug domain-containing protein, partial [Xanthomonadaceae bacterium]|nr:TonB-dependent receptor plug domain-containing protein [Xanthomonadaceae bacterium]